MIQSTADYRNFQLNTISHHCIVNHPWTIFCCALLNAFKDFYQGMFTEGSSVFVRSEQRYIGCLCEWIHKTEKPPRTITSVHKIWKKLNDAFFVQTNERGFNFTLGQWSNQFGRFSATIKKFLFFCAFHVLPVLSQCFKLQSFHYKIILLYLMMKPHEICFFEF